MEKKIGKPIYMCRHCGERVISEKEVPYNISLGQIRIWDEKDTFAQSAIPQIVHQCFTDSMSEETVKRLSYYGICDIVGISVVKEKESESEDMIGEKADGK